MAKIILSGLDLRTAAQLESLLLFDGHDVDNDRRHAARPAAAIQDLIDADIVFVGGRREQFLPLVRRMRAIDPSLPLVVALPLQELGTWLEALDAGATDFCCAPFDPAQIRALIAFSLRVQRPVSRRDMGREMQLDSFTAETERLA